MACSVCSAPVADMFTPNGDAVCKRCFYADDIKRKESGLPRALINSGIAAIVFGLALMVVVGLLGGRATAMGILGGGLLAGGAASIREGRRRKRLMAGR